MKTPIYQLPLWFMACLFLGMAHATTTVPTVSPDDPHLLLKHVTSKLEHRIKKLEPAQLDEPIHMMKIVEEELMPHIDHELVAYKLLGQNVKKASRQQLSDFVDVTRVYLVETYASSLTLLADKTIVHHPGKTGSKKIVASQMSLKQENAPDTKLLFKFRKSRKTGQWKAFDVVVEGISLVNAKRSEFGAVIRSEGLGKLVKNLQEKYCSSGGCTKPTNSNV